MVKNKFVELKNLWRKCPWLWAINAHWDKDSTAIRFFQAEEDFLQTKIDYKKVDGIYLKVVHIYGSDVSIHEIRLIDLPAYSFRTFLSELTLEQIIMAQINEHFEAVEKIIFVRHVHPGERSLKSSFISIFSPPKGKKYFNQPTG